MNGQYYLSFSNNMLPLRASNLCEPISCECNYSKEPLNLGFSFFSPVSSVQGSSTFFFLQPLLTGKVFASVGILIATQLLMFLANRLFGLESMPIQKSPLIFPEQTVRMSLSDLQDFLASMSRGNVQPSTGTSTRSSGQADTGTLSPEPPETPLVFSLAVWGEFTNKFYSPSVFLIFPLLTFKGVRGALPLLILELLTTIFVRAVVPPQTTGSEPLTNSPSTSKLELLQFSPEDLSNLLNRLSKHFRI